MYRSRKSLSTLYAESAKCIFIWPNYKWYDERMTKFAVLAHGKDGAPSKGWLPWAKRKLKDQGFVCETPAFPPQDDSKPADWFSIFNRLQVDFEHTTFVAHARGAMALLRWINTLPADTRIHQIITISCNFDYQPNRTDGDEFYTKPLDYADLMRKCRNITVIHSEDDPYVSIAAGEQLAANLHAKFVRLQTAGHFGSEKLEAPEILKELVGS